MLSKVTVNNNFGGISVIGSSTLNVTIVDSEASNNRIFAESAGFGVGADGPATAVMVRNSVASNNNIGLEASDNAILRVAHSVVTGSDTGVNTQSGGTIRSYGDNDINGNSNNNTGVLTVIPTH